MSLGIAAAAAENGGVDADEPAFSINQRATGIARVDGGVGLDEILVLVEARQTASAQGADNPHGDRLANAEGIPDGQNHIANLQQVAVGKRDGRQAGGFDFQDGHIGRRIGADNLGGVILLVTRHVDLDFTGPLNHVVGGQDVTVGRNDDARAQTFRFARADRVLIGILETVAKKLAEPRVAEKRVLPYLFPNDACGGDVDHTRGGALDNGRETRPELGVPIDRRGGYRNIRAGTLAPERQVKQADHEQGAHSRRKESSKRLGKRFHTSVKLTPKSEKCSIEASGLSATGTEAFARPRA